MMNQHGEAQKLPPILIVSALALLLGGIAWVGHRSAVSHTVETFYSQILASPPPRLEKYPTETARLDRAETILAGWQGLDSPELDFERMKVDLSFPLRITRTLRVANPEDLRKRAGEIFARDLAVLTGRKAAMATPSAWAAEIAAWKTAISLAGRER